MTHRLRFAARSDRGLLRSNNQDSVYAGERLLVVADGMGGHAAGDLASRVVVAAFAEIDAEAPGDDLTRPLARALDEGNEAIAAMVDDDPDLDGMGTTATALLFDGDRMALAHIGDSRAYLYRGGVLQQLSHDDTFVQSLVDDGRITEEEAAQHPQRNLLLRALNGTEPEPMLALREISLGDRYMICSDGLSSVVDAEAIADTLADPDPDSAADRLIELALVAGGPDNVTVIVADVVEVGARAVVPPPTGPVDLDATGPIKPIHVTQRMPRVPLPAIPDDVPAAPQYLDGDDADEYPGGQDDEYDDDYDPDDEPPTERIMATPDPAERRRTRRRTLAIVGTVVAALVIAVAGTLLWTRSQYYVGDAGGQVVVYRGVSGSVLGVSLASVIEDSCADDSADCVPIRLDDLQQDARDTVLAGIDVNDLDRAHAVLAELRGRLLDYCDTVTPTPTTTGTRTSPSGASTAERSSPVSSGADTTGSRTTGPRTTDSATADTGTTGSRSTGSRSTNTRTSARTSASASRPNPSSRGGDRLRDDAQRFTTTSGAPSSPARSSADPTGSSNRPTTDAAGLPTCRPRR